MAKTLIIYAHPATEGHCSFMLEQILTKLKEEKQDYELLDLYKMKYDPVLKEEEHYIHTANRHISPQNKAIQAKIKAADKLIFVYPIWWGTMPAIMKGFIDRVFTSHFAFKYEGSMPKGLLQGRKAAVFITSGVNETISDVFLAGRPKKSISKDILRFCGIKSRAFQVGGSTKLTDAQKKKISAKVKQGLNWLN